MHLQKVKKFLCKLIPVCCLLLFLFSLLLFFPHIRLLIVSLVERSIVHRPLRDVEKWSRLIRGCAGALLLASIMLTLLWLKR